MLCLLLFALGFNEIHSQDQVVYENPYTTKEDEKDGSVQSYETGGMNESEIDLCEKQAADHKESE